MTVEVRFKVSDENAKELQSLSQDLGCSDDLKGLIDNAITLIKSAVAARKEGRIIASIDEVGKSYREIKLPALDQIKPTEQPREVAQPSP